LLYIFFTLIFKRKW